MSGSDPRPALYLLTVALLAFSLAVVAVEGVRWVKARITTFLQETSEQHWPTEGRGPQRW